MNDLIEKELIKAKRFIQCGVDMNFPAGFERRSNVVMAATVDGCAELLDWMLKNGGDPNATNRKGFTALGMAIEAGCLGATQVLRAAGALVGHGHDQAAVHRVRHRRPARRHRHSEQGEEGFQGGKRRRHRRQHPDARRQDRPSSSRGGRPPFDHTRARQGGRGRARATATGSRARHRDAGSKWLAALELLRCGACPSVRVCETERAFLRALKIARESEANLVAVYWCGGSSPALSG